MITVKMFLYTKKIALLIVITTNLKKQNVIVPSKKKETVTYLTKINFDKTEFVDSFYKVLKIQIFWL